MVVLVTGANGQLGQSIQYISKNHKEMEFVFCDSTNADITNINQLRHLFKEVNPKFCINAAAYTAVDKAEIETVKAQLINVIGAKNLAEVCKENNTILLHVSTDFVFDGNRKEESNGNKKPYTEEDTPNPTSVYGQTKLDGEKAIQEIWEKHFIIRTSWVYSQFGNNFMKTMLRLAKERETLSVVNDQIGTPTNALDLAEVLVKIILTHNSQLTTHNFGIYNFSNEDQCSWYDFAKEIFENNNIKINLLPIPSTSFPTPAKRPKYSVLDKSKIKHFFNLKIEKWEDSLKKNNL